MKLNIVDEDGETVGELDTTPATQWLDLLLYVSQRWEEQAQTQQHTLLALRTLDAILGAKANAPA